MALNNKQNHDEEALIMDFLNDELNEQEKLILVTKLAENPGLAAKIGDMQKTWLLLGKMESPDPSLAMDQNFHNMLNEFKQQTSKPARSIETSQIWNFISNLWPTHFAARSLVSALLIIVVFFAGYWMSTTSNYNLQIAKQEDKIKTLQSEMLLTLLDEKSPLTRLKAVSISHELDETNSQIIAALLKTLQEDDNDNVRLASLEALLPYANQPEVRLGLVASIKFQNSPLVQMALAEAMVALQEKTSIGPLKELIENENTPQEIKNKIQESIDVLI